jgi:protein required for attachment to host cells
MSKFWLVAGNGTHARVFAGDGPSADLTEIETFVNATGGIQEQDLVSDRPGRNPDPSGLGRSGVKETTHREHSMDEFARRLADYLGEHREAGDFNHLTIVASPSLLGRLRPNLSKMVQSSVLEELAKDVTTETPQQIQERLTRLGV